MPEPFSEFGETAMDTEIASRMPVASALTRPVRKLDKIFRSYRLFRRGAALVEFAFVAPVLLLLVMGMIESGRLVMVQQVLTNATREGARHAVLDGATTASTNAVVNDFLTASRISGAVVTVTPDPPSNAVFGDPVTVSVQVPFGQVSWLPTPMFLSGKTLSATTVMRRETAQ
jgi:Flp pilus assembly protein TadG